MKKPASRPSVALFVSACVLLLASGLSNARAATPHNMSTSDYSENFGDIANWGANFASGIGAAPWGSVAINATGTIPDGKRTSVSTATFASGTSGGVQKGSGTLNLLSTGGTDNTSACAVDLFLDFTGRNAGTLSFDWAQVNNSTGDRAASLRVYTSTDGTTFTELAVAWVMVTNNFTPLSSGSRSSLALPSSFNNSSTARIRFYNHNGVGGTTPTGSRPKIAIDNIAVTSTADGGGTAASIEAQPANATVNEGSTTNFTVVAAGTAPISYQWQFEGEDISAATDSTLIIASAQFSNAGNYQVIVDNAYGNAVTSSVVTLTVLSNAPSITLQPQSQNVVSGTNVTFTVAVIGSAPLLFQWYKNTAPITDATNASLTISNVSESDAGNYSCMVSNGGGSVTSSNAALLINANFVTAMTYNVKGNGISDSSTNTAKVQAIGRQLVHLQPDIVTFNEIPNGDYAQITNLVKQYLPGYYYATNSASDGFIRSAIVSRWPITRSEKWLDNADLDPFGYTLSNFTRDLFEAEINVPGFTEPFHAFTTHLKSGSASDDCAKRAAEALCISNFFVNGFLTTNASHPYVLTGDLNEDINRPPGPSQQPIQKLISSPTGLFLTTPTNSFDASSGNDMTFSIQSLPLAHRYDYILPGGLLYSNIFSSQVFRTDLLSPLPPALIATDSADASDHLPVLITFSNPNTAAPTIIAQPSSLTNSAGSTAVFTISAGGAVPLSYQWFKAAAPLSDGGNIAGATTASLTISSVLAADAGSYSVTVTNFAGSTNSSAATLTVLDPAILFQPSSLTLNPDDTATFSVSAGGTAPLTYRWRKGGLDLSDSGNVSGSTSATLTLSNVSSGDEGSYSVLVSNLVSTVVSSNAFLNVRDPVAISSHPASRTNNAGTTATFAVSATGTSLSYQWLKNGSPLNNGGIVSGATSATLSLTGVFGTDAGGYSVVVSNAVNVLTSSVAALTVIDPVITSQPSSASVAIGGSATFSVLANGSAPLTYQWKKNGVDLNDSGNIAGSLTTSLTIASATVLDAASYSVTVSNLQGTATSASATLSLLSTGGEVYLNNPSYTQNFDSMGTAPTASLPGGWKMSGPAGAAAPNFAAAGNFASVSQAASGGSPTTGGRYNWGNGSNTSDRAPGFMTSGSYASPNSLMAGFLNNNPSNITALNLSFEYERYRSNTAAAAITFFLSTDGANWTAHTAGDSGPFNTGTSSYQFANQTVVSNWLTISNLDIPTNTTFYLRWNFNTTGGNSQGLGLDNFNLAASFEVPPPNLTINTHPVSQTVWENTNVSFTVSASGTQPIAYQWYFDGSPLMDETNATLNLFAVTTNDSGEYLVTVTNAAGMIYSDIATLTVMPPIATNIAYLRTLVDASDWLPTDTTNLFQVEGIVITHTNLSGPLDAQFYFQDGTGGLACFIAGGSLDRPAPGDLVRVTGKLGHFNGLLQFALVASNPTHHVEILSTDNDLPSPANLLISDQNETELIEALEGSRVVISNVLIDLTSATFATNTTIKITNANNLAETMDLRIDARVTDFQDQLKPTNVVSIIGVLGQFDNSNPRNSGYQLLPTRFADVIPTLVDPPIILGQPSNIVMTIQEGAEAGFEVVASGVSLSYQWRTNGVAVGGATDSSFTWLNTQPGDTAIAFSVEVSNPAGSVVSSDAFILAVQGDSLAPKITLTTPKPKGGTNAAEVTVTGLVKDTGAGNSGIISWVKYVHNGGNELTSTVTNTANLLTALKPGQVPFESAGPITLTPGTNIIQILASDLAGNQTSYSTIFYYDLTNVLTLNIIGQGGVKMGSAVWNSTTNIANTFKVGRPYKIDAFVGKGTNYVFTNWVTSPVDVGHATNVWTQKSKLSFVMQEGMTITATFNTNPFTPLIGTYNGLFYNPTSITHETAGFIQVKVKDKSVYSGYVIFDGDKTTFSGKFNTAATITRDLLRTKVSKDPVTLELTVNTNETISGTVSSNEVWSSAVGADKAVFDLKAVPPVLDTDYAGSYTVQIPTGAGAPSGSPGGVGYGTVTNNAGGIIKFAGLLGDGEKLSQSVNVSRNGAWPLYVGLYKEKLSATKAYKGAFMGWVNFTTNADFGPSSNNVVTWIKKDGSESTLRYAGGFTNTVELAGSKYVATGPGVTPVPLLPGDYIIVSDGNLTEPVTNEVVAVAGTASGTKVTLNKTNTVGAINKATITFKHKDGTFSGGWFDSAINPGVKTVTKGVVLQNSNSAAGFFLGTTESGTVRIE